MIIFLNLELRFQKGIQPLFQDNFFFIHGGCSTVGCLPVTDDKIKEIYLLSIYAKNNGQERIPVYIFPFEMTNKNYFIQNLTIANNKDLLGFWENLKTGYERFFEYKQELLVSVNNQGRYVFSD